MRAKIHKSGKRYIILLIQAIVLQIKNVLKICFLKRKKLGIQVNLISIVMVGQTLKFD